MQALIKSWFTYLTVEKGLSTNTLAAYRRSIERYESWLASEKLDDPKKITTKHIESYYASLRGSNLSDATANHALVVVRQFHDFLLREGLVDQDVAKDVHPAKGEKALPEFLTLAEVDQVIDAAKDQCEAALVELLYGTGARVSEALALSVDDVNRYEGFVVLTGKGNKQRIVPLGSKAQQAISAYIRGQRKDLVKPNSPDPHRLFLNRLGRPYSRQSAYNNIQALLARAGIEKTVSPHTFRHTFATHMLAGGADMRVVQELLGHASISTTQVYTHVRNAEVLEAHHQFHPRG
ncbi:MAG: tyrosine recombinase [Corynebacterium sp.]|nr:tyrosine recombinase [Corynebacterium sp.]